MDPIYGIRRKMKNHLCTLQVHMLVMIDVRFSVSVAELVYVFAGPTYFREKQQFALRDLQHDANW